MAPINPGLADDLSAAAAIVYARERTAEDNTVEGSGGKQMACGHLLLLVAHLERPDGTNALDYSDEERSDSENFYKSQVVRLLALLLDLEQSDPTRDWDEVVELSQTLETLQTVETTNWTPEIIRLGTARGITVARGEVIGGLVAFQTPGGFATANVYKARTPDVTLEAASAYLIEELPKEGEAQPTGRYAVMVDDAYWGRRIQPAAFAPAPLDEEIVMGYRLRGRILASGIGVPYGNVSLQLTLRTTEDGGATAWDSLEYNELVWDYNLATYVQGPTVLAPIRTDDAGRWEFIGPKGHGAYYQRAGDLRDDSPETAACPLRRYVERIECAYKGRMIEVVEGAEAVLNTLSATLEITGEPGTSLLVGTMDNPGVPCSVPAEGVVTIQDLPQAENSIVAFKLTSWGAWDQEWGCPRAIAQTVRGETTRVTLPPLEHYTTPEVLCGRVYERPGVPAQGIGISVLDMEAFEIIAVVTHTDADGWWTVTIPPEGLGGELLIHDPTWGSVPVLGIPYSDIVLGARAYASNYEIYKPEAWRRPERGHANFQYCPGSVEVRTPEGEIIATEPTDYGGWVTTSILAKHAYVADLEELVMGGAQSRQYDLLVDGEVAIAGFELRSQPFEGQDTAPGRLRAAGYYPEVKFLMGGKIHGDIVKGKPKPVHGNMPEAARVGLEFGEYEPYIEARAVAPDIQTRSCLADLTCPYCGGPAHRDPEEPDLRGHCIQCADLFGRPDAMDCRGWLATPTMAGTGEERRRLRLVQASPGIGEWSRLVRYHWRPDLYEETPYFLTQSGPEQPTNAPRWVSKHVNEVMDGLGFGRFDGDASPPLIAGHDLDYFAGLPQVEHEIAATQLKLVFAYDYVTPLTYTVDLDCRRLDGLIETRRVTIEEGTKGPSIDDDFGDVIRVAEVDKLLAEDKGQPWAGTGLYVGISDVRLVDPPQAPGCRFDIVNDVPVLCSVDGIAVAGRKATPIAVQVVGAWGNPHLTDDAVGQLFMFWAERGDIFMSHRRGLPRNWVSPRRITGGGDADEPWGGKDEAGQLTLVCMRGGHRAQVLRSRDDGRHWEEVE